MALKKQDLCDQNDVQGGKIELTALYQVQSYVFVVDGVSIHFPNPVYRFLPLVWPGVRRTRNLCFPNSMSSP